jgi:hypothetical protein
MTFPSRTIEIVEIMFNTSFVAVPHFNGLSRSGFPDRGSAQSEHRDGAPIYFERRIETEKNVWLPRFLASAKAPQTNGVLPLARDPDQSVSLDELPVTNACCTGFPIVFGSFHCLPESGLTTSDDALDHFRRGTKGGRAFARIQDAEASTRSSADVEEATAGFQRVRSETDSALNLPLFLRSAGMTSLSE